MSRANSAVSRVIAITSLIIAAEAIFTLPYHVARFFRPTLLSVLGLDNMQLGLVQSSYGIVAMLAYFPGGPLADLFSARKLLTVSLVTTAAGGFYFATLPSFDGLWILFGFWGLTTILLFWAALIRATREWGEPSRQGRAYGLLDAGRGLLAAAMASVAVLVFALFFPANTEALTEQDRIEAIRSVILFYTGMTFSAALLTWFFVKEPEVVTAGAATPRISLGCIRDVFALPGVWLLATIIVCAYVGYKGIDYYSLFAVEVYGLSEVEGAKLSAMGAWIRPVAALGAGLLGDRILSSRATSLGFGLLILGYGVSAWADVSPATVWVFFFNLVVTSAAVYGLRGVYFALLEEGAVPAVATGTAVGIVSVIGYSPDVFFSVLAGWLIDTYPGASGYRYFCLIMVAFGLTGLVASLSFTRRKAISRPA